MRKSILWMCMIGVTLFMTSCLKEGTRDYTDASITYIAQDNSSGVVYGRTLTGRLITSDAMQLMFPGSFQFLRYSWTEEYGTKLIENIQVDNVMITGDPVEISRVALRMNQEPPVVETPLKFVAIDQPVFAADHIYLGDHWLFQYAYEAKKGETPVVNFYYKDDEEAPENEITIDVVLSITGEPDAGSSTTTKTEILALNMSQLRAAFEGSSATTTKDLKITFQYYLKGRDQIVESQEYLLKVKGD